MSTTFTWMMQGAKLECENKFHVCVSKIDPFDGRRVYLVYAKGLCGDYSCVFSSHRFGKGVKKYFGI